MTSREAVDVTAARIHRILADLGPVVVGDALVAVYAPETGHRPDDLDLVVPGPLATVRERLAADGWRRRGRLYWHAELPLPADLVGSELQVGAQAAAPVLRDSPAGPYRLLSPTDAALDRLAGWLHWDNAWDGDMARAILAVQPVDRAILQRWLEAEGATARQIQEWL